MADNYMVEPKKRRIITDCEKCFICKKGSSETEPLIQLDYKRCESLISVCKSRGQQDDILPSILNNEDKIKAGEFKIYYHKKCRTNFMLPVYRDIITEKENNGDSILSEQFTRSKAAEFDWKVNCFICGQNCHPKKRKTWSLVAGAINERSNTYSDVVKAAEIRNDRAMLARMLSSNWDLVAVEARYHRDKGCLRTYINERNVKAANTTPEKSSHVKVCEMLKIELYQAVVHEKRVCELAVLKERFIEIASENKILVNSNIATNSFKKILSSTWPELRFIERKGKTDLVCIDMMSVEEAVLRLVNIETELNKSCEYEKEIETFDEGISYSDEICIVHKAAVILRNRVVNATHPSNKSYFSPEEITPQGQKSYLDPLLLKFVNWLSNKEKSDTGDDIDGDIDQRVVAISSDITALISTSQITPKHLGLSVYLHHTFGSKKLIEDLCVLGYTVSYAEMRHFLTSAALHVSNKESRTQSGAQVPSAVKSKEESVTLMITVADNWDHNEHTCSGKNSTHAMTSILGKLPHVHVL